MMGDHLKIEKFHPGSMYIYPTPTFDRTNCYEDSQLIFRFYKKYVDAFKFAPVYYDYEGTDAPPKDKDTDEPPKEEYSEASSMDESSCCHCSRFCP